MNKKIQELWETFCADPTEEHFAPFYECTRALVYTICYRILRNEEDARDALQATYYRLLHVAKNPEEEEESREEIEKFVGIFAVREANNLLQRRKRRRMKEIAVEHLPSFPDSIPTPDEIATNHELHDRIEQILTMLPEKFRVPIVLHYFQGMTHGEIAKALEAPASTISSRITIGLKKLQPHMRAAGLGESVTALSAITGMCALLQPPSTLAAATVFVSASAAASGVAVTATTLGTVIEKALSHFVFLFSPKTVALLAAIGTAAFVILNFIILPSPQEIEAQHEMISNLPEDPPLFLDVAFLPPFHGSNSNSNSYIIHSYPMWAFLCYYTTALVDMHDLPQPLHYSDPKKMREKMREFKKNEWSKGFTIDEYARLGEEIKCNYIVSHDYVVKNFNRDIHITVRIFDVKKRRFVYENTHSFAQDELTDYKRHIRGYYAYTEAALPLAEKILFLHDPDTEFISEVKEPDEDAVSEARKQLSSALDEYNYTSLFRFASEMSLNFKEYPTCAEYWSYLSIAYAHLAFLLDHKTDLYQELLTRCYVSAFLALHFEPANYEAKKSLAVAMWRMGDYNNMETVIKGLASRNPSDLDLAYYRASFETLPDRLLELRDASSTGTLFYTIPILDKLRKAKDHQTGISESYSLLESHPHHPVIKSRTGKLLWYGSRFRDAAALFVSATVDNAIQGLEMLLPLARELKCLEPEFENEAAQLIDRMKNKQMYSERDFKEVSGLFNTFMKKLKVEISLRTKSGNVRMYPVRMSGQILVRYYEDVFVKEYLNYADTYIKQLSIREAGEAILLDLEKLFPDNLMVVNALADFYFTYKWTQHLATKYNLKIGPLYHYYPPYQLRQAKFAQNVNRKEAIDALAYNIITEPYDYDLLMEMADKAADLHGWDWANTAYKKASRLYPKRIAPDLKKLKIKMLRNGSRLTREELDTYRDIPGATTDTLLALLYKQNGYNDTAIELYKKCIAVKPEDRTLYRELAKIYQGMGLYDNYFDTWQDFIREVPNTLGTARAYHDIFWYHFCQGKFKEAEKYLEMGDAGQEGAMWNRGYFLYALGENEAAEKVFLACIDRYHSKTAKDDLRMLYMRTNNWEPMLTLGDQYIREAEHERCGYLFKASYYIRNKNFASAEQALNAYRNRMINDDEPFYYLADYFMERGNLKSALYNNDESLKRATYNVHNQHFQKAEILLRKKNYIEAKKELDYCMVNYMRYYGTHDLLARYYLLLGNIPNAEQSAEFNKNFLFAYGEQAATQARILMAKGEHEKALELMLLNDRITLDITPYRKYFLGEVLRENGMHEEAKEAYQWVIDLCGEDGYYGKMAVNSMKKL